MAWGAVVDDEGFWGPRPNRFFAGDQCFFISPLHILKANGFIYWCHIVHIFSSINYNGFYNGFHIYILISYIHSQANGFI